MSIISKDTPIAEITLRKYEHPKNLPKRELIRKLCLSIGLLQPGDSRDVIVDILHSLIENKEQTTEQIKKQVIKSRMEMKFPLLGIAPSNIRRQLKRLRDLYIVEKVKNKYRITESENFSTIFKEKIEAFYLKSIIERVKEYFDAL